jgi:hypothetical protein
MRLITKKQLDDANLAVTRELSALGFWDEALAETETYLTPAGRFYGYQMYESSGEILIPSISVSRLGEKLMGQKRLALRDILRHEFGHAYAHTHPKKMKNKTFERVFGGPHEIDSALGQEYDPARHVTEYAANMPLEDFAEVFMFYVKHKGKLPAKFDTPAIRKKWNFVAALPMNLPEIAKPAAKKRTAPKKNKVIAPESRLDVRITQQSDPYSCGAHAVLALLKHHQWETTFRGIKEHLGTEHTLPMMPGRKHLERLLNKHGIDLKGTYPVDIFITLWNFRFTTALLPFEENKLKRRLTEEFKNGRPVLALTYNGSYFHWILLTGIHEDGVYTADSLQPESRSRMDWDEIQTDLLGAIAAISGDDLLTSALLRSSRFDVTLMSRLLKRLVHSVS